MQIFKWNNQLETGNELIDFEHKIIIQIYNDCVALAQSGTENEKLIVRVNELHGKIANHFKTEEIIANCILASSAGKLKLAKHKERHDFMLNYLKTTIPKLTDRENNSITAQEVLEHIYEWYETHIENEDKDFVTHVKQGFVS